MAHSEPGLDETVLNEDAVCGERGTSLRKFWSHALDAISAGTFTRQEAVLQMLVVATHAMETTFGADTAAQCYTDQVALLLAKKQADDRLAAELAAAPRH